MLLNKRPVLAIVPARGGSKGVPRKNMALLMGRPLIEYTLRAALDAEGIDEVWLSSDDDEILLFGKTLDVYTLYRPAEYATDIASPVNVVKHFIATIPSHILIKNPLIVYLQPTSPLRTGRHIQNALYLLREHGASSLISVAEFMKSPYKGFEIDSNGRLKSLFDEKLSNMRRQDLPPLYIPNGAIYIFSVSEFNDRNGFPSNGSIPYIMTEKESIDIDSYNDFEHVELILTKRID